MANNLIDKIFEDIDQEQVAKYQEYWEKITPKTNEEYYNRWVFSFLSVHTTWNANVGSYLLLRDNAEAWLHNKQELENLLKRGACGLYKRRTEGLWLFKYLFWEDPEGWKKRPDEEWFECRARLQKRCNGLGFAKTAFALELCYPLACESVCLDTHMLQLYGYDVKSQRKVASGVRYIQLENDWIARSREKQVPSYIARCIFWDKKQRRPDSRYWSYCLE